MNKKQAVKEALLAFSEKADQLNDSAFQEMTLNLAHKLEGYSKPPMPAWKKKLYLVLGSLTMVWVLFHYLSYEACREKYPNAAAWVCVMSPK